MQPVRSSLFLMLKVSRLRSLPSDAGMSPERLFSDMLKNTSSFRLPSEAGIGPVNLLSLKLSDRSSVSSPISGGMMPSSWLLLAARRLQSSDLSEFGWNASGNVVAGDIETYQTSHSA